MPTTGASAVTVAGAMPVWRPTAQDNDTSHRQRWKRTVTPRIRAVADSMRRPDMEVVLSSAQGEAASSTVVGDAASVDRTEFRGGERVVVDASSSLIYAGWLPQDGLFCWSGSRV